MSQPMSEPPPGAVQFTSSPDGFPMDVSGRSASVRMCVRCQKITEEPVVVREVHSNSGPGWNVYACPGCAPGFPPAVDVHDVLDAVRRRTRGEGR